MEADTLSDPARFADAIRGVARDAHRALRHAPSPAALRELSRHIEQLSSALGDARGGPLGAWLEDLGQVVRSAAVRPGQDALANLRPCGAGPARPVTRGPAARRRGPAPAPSCRRRELCRMSS